MADTRHEVRHPGGEEALAALHARTPAVIAPGHTFESVTESISHIVLSKRTPIGWFFGFAIAFVLLLVLNVTIAKLLLTGAGSMTRNLCGFLSQALHLPVELGNPLKDVGDNKSKLSQVELEAIAPRLAIAIGLALEGEE